VPDLQRIDGLALWVLTKMALAAGINPLNFNSYVKRLRKLGVEFHINAEHLRCTSRSGARGLVQFGYDLYAREHA